MMDAALQHILTGCKNNERTAQKALYGRYCNLFMMMCLRYVNTEADAEEILNNAFLRIYKHINKYSGQGSLEGWMKKIVANCCLTYIAKPGYKVLSKIIPIQSGNSYHQPNCLKEIAVDNTAVEDRHHKDHLLTLLKNLPGTTRLVFNLYVFEEYNHSEIGALLGMAERTSQGHLATARKILRNEFDKEKLMAKILRV